MKEKRRLFLALPIPQYLKEEILKGRSKINLNLKWIPEEKLHITVLFLGGVPVEMTDQISLSVHSIVKNTSSFSLLPQSFKIQKGRFQEMIWVSFHKSVEFEKLSKELAEALGYASKRKAVPHINLVRSKEKINSDVLPFDFSQSFELPVNQIELWESHLSPKGSTYSSLKSFSLKS